MEDATPAPPQEGLSRTTPAVHLQLGARAGVASRGLDDSALTPSGDAALSILLDDVFAGLEIMGGNVRVLDLFFLAKYMFILKYVSTSTRFAHFRTFALL